MFNETTKREFINDSKERNVCIDKVMETLFGNSEPFERTYNKDISNFTVSEIIDMYKFLSTSSLERLMVLNSEYANYCDWCLRNYLVKDSQNHFRELDNYQLTDCLNLAKVNDMIISRDDLLNDLKEIENPSEQFVALAVFEGIGGRQLSDFYHLTIDSFNGNEVRLPNRTLIVSDELVKMAEESANEYNYYTYNTTGSERYSVRKFQMNDDRIVKLLSNAVRNTEESYGRTVARKLNRLKNVFGKVAYSTAGLSESGRIHLIKNIMKENNMSFDDAVMYYNRNYDYIYGRIYSIARYKIRYGKFYNDTEE